MFPALRSFALIVLPLALSPGCSGPEERPLTPEELAERDNISELLRLFVDQDPGWPEARDKALQDPHTGELLAGNFVLGMNRGYQRARGDGAAMGPWSLYRKCQNELVMMAKYSIPVLIAGLSRKDRVIVTLVGETLALIGVPAVAPLEQRYRVAEMRERIEILKIFGAIEDVSMLPTLQRYKQEAAWQLRGEAMRSIGLSAARLKRDHEARKQAFATLSHHLQRDDDSFVRRKAAEGLGHLGGTDSVKLLLRFYRLGAVQSTRRSQEREALLDALRRATGLPGAHRVVEFEHWLKTVEGKAG